MFYFLLAPTLIWHGLLIVAAVLPAVILMIRLYRSDRLEKESPAILKRCVWKGICATILAMAAEGIGQVLLGAFFDEGSLLYSVLLYFGLVAFAEEGAKLFMLRRATWNDPEFNCTYDGVIYSAFVAAGFALWENISYVLHYGLGTAFIRAVTAVPGHISFGVFMGLFYSRARLADRCGCSEKARRMERLALVIPALLHGLYDYVASTETAAADVFFLVFVAVLFLFTVSVARNAAEKDTYL